MDRLLKALFQIQEFKIRNDDDFIDRLNRQYTPCILVLFTVLVSVKQYVGDPINCWCPAQFTASHQEYTNTVCWVSDTYYVPFERDMPRVEDPRQLISYYQWVPLILMSQAGFFFLPYILWRFLNRRSGVNLGSVIEAAMACQKSLYNDTREKTVRFMVSQIDGYLLASRSYKKGCWPRIKSFGSSDHVTEEQGSRARSHSNETPGGAQGGGCQGACSEVGARLCLKLAVFLKVLAQHCCLFCGKLYGNYLVCTYLMVKLMYIGNAVGQLFMLDFFLGMHRDYHLYGIHVLKRMVEGSDWTSSERFPRVTLCDFEIRQQTNVHRYTVQCVLPINLFNEKIFVFLWFWLLFMAIATTVGFCHWCSKCLFLPMQLAYIKRQLKAIDFHKRESKAARKFTESYLRRDGVLIVRLVGKNAGDMVAAELLHGLWLNYGPERRGLGDNNGQNTPIRAGNRTPIVSQDIV